MLGVIFSAVVPEALIGIKNLSQYAATPVNNVIVMIIPTNVGDGNNNTADNKNIKAIAR